MKYSKSTLCNTKNIVYIILKNRKDWVKEYYLNKSVIHNILQKKMFK